MKRRKISIRYRKARCLLSDMLPYEVPLSFSNRHFYDFVERHRIECDGKTVSWLNSGPEIEHFVHLLFSLPFDANRLSDRIDHWGRKIREYKSEKPTETIPFRFKIAHKEREFRELAVPHPRHQAEMVHFYDKGKEIIIYLCSRSPYSIRKPVQMATCVYYKDSTHYVDLATDAPIVEQGDKVKWSQ